MVQSRKVSPQLFRRVAGNFVTGVTVATTRGPDDRPYGLTVSSFTSLSLKPPLVLICLDNELSGLPLFLEHGWFGISILSEEQERISRLFATRGSDRDADLYRTGRSGLPLLKGSLATLECEITGHYPGGDHTIVLGGVRFAAVSERAGSANPLIFFCGAYRQLASR